MDVPLNVAVYCTDGYVGRSTNVILNPVTHKISHVVVALEKRPYTEFLVSIKRVAATTPASINLALSSSELRAKPRFIETEFVSAQVPEYLDAYSWPMTTISTKRHEVSHRNIPLHEMVVRRGAKIKATDGVVGRIDEFIADADGHITHLVMRYGHRWEQRDIAIPVSDIAHFGEQLVELKLTKEQVEKMPTVQIHRQRA